MRELKLPSGLTATFDKYTIAFRTSNNAHLYLRLQQDFTSAYWEIETGGQWVVNKDHIKQLIEALQYVLESCE